MCSATTLGKSNGSVNAHVSSHACCHGRDAGGEGEGGRCGAGEGGEGNGAAKGSQSCAAGQSLAAGDKGAEEGVGGQRKGGVTGAHYYASLAEQLCYERSFMRIPPGSRGCLAGRRAQVQDGHGGNGERDGGGNGNGIGNGHAQGMASPCLTARLLKEARGSVGAEAQAS